MLIGLVGKPSCGKSTFFKAVTLAEVDIAPHPFTTIKPNHGVGFVRVKCVDKDFKIKCEPKHGYCLDNIRFVPIELLDVAGLIEGSHLGKGLGNQFLNDLSTADALIHVVDISGSTDEKGEQVEIGSYDPMEDIRMLEHEIDMWLYGLLKKRWGSFSKIIQQEKKDLIKEIAKEFSGLKITEEIVVKCFKKLNLSMDASKWSDDHLLKFSSEVRKLSKPMIIACNKIDIDKSNNFKRLKEELSEHILVPCSAESELALREAAKKDLIKYTAGDKDFKILEMNKLNDRQKKGLEFIKKNVLEKFGSSGVEDVLDRTVFELLNLIAVYPVANNKLEDKDGRKLPDCFLVRKDITALNFAFKVHTDLGNNFVKAMDMRTKQVVGKDAKLKHRDVIEIISGK